MKWLQLVQTMSSGRHAGTASASVTAQCARLLNINIQSMFNTDSKTYILKKLQQNQVLQLSSWQLSMQIVERVKLKEGRPYLLYFKMYFDIKSNKYSLINLIII